LSKLINTFCKIYNYIKFVIRQQLNLLKFFMMKKLLILLVSMVCTWHSAQAFNVTFSVDMNNVAASFTTANLNGNFNGWCGACAPMTDSNMDGVWEITIPLDAGTWEYKFTYDGWTGQETLVPGSPCTLTTGAFTNRVITVTADTTLPTVCWEACTDCSAAPVYHDITFQLDMNNVTETFITPEINGTFNGWCGACAPMADINDDGIWEITISLLEGSTVEYKFAYDNWANGGESLIPGSPCTVTTDGFTNRTLTITGDAILPAVCWASCSACNVVLLDQMNLPVTFEDANIDYGVIGFGGAEESTIEVDPTDATNTAVKVIKSATAATWAGTTITNAAETGLASAIPFDATNTQMTLRVWSPDAGIAVLLKVEDHNDPTHSCQTLATTTMANVWETLTFDFANEQPLTAPLNLSYYLNKASVFFNYGVEGAIAGEKTYYFDDLMFGGASQPTMRNITFQVDMNNVTETFTTPEVNGNFNGWCGNCAPMTDTNNDGIWELTLMIEEGTYEYKYSYDNWAGQETLASGSTCTITTDGFTNRTLTVTADAVLPVVCFASCNACSVQPVMYDVTFQVDMNNVTEAFTTPEVNGTFNGWCGACAPMTDTDADGIWELTLSLEAGTHQFKYAYDNWANGGESLTPGSSCTVTDGGFTNRALTVSEDMVMPVVCYSSCFACGAAGFYNILFRVDMNEVTSAFTTPEVNGTFNGWCGACAPMSDADGDGVWELVIALEAGSYEYKFANDNWAGQETLAPGSSCTLTSGEFTNRVLTVTGEQALDAVCWGSCTTCDNPQGPFNVTFIVDMSQVTDVFTTPEVNGSFNGWCGGCAPMSDANGDNIWELTIPLAADTFDYKFAYDTWAGQETLTPGSACTYTIDSFTNRRIIVTGAAALDTVCWASCAACIVNVEEIANANRVTIYPNPAQDFLQIEFAKAINKQANITIMDASGRMVVSQKITIAKRYTVDTANMTEGMYFIHLTTDDINYNQSFMVKN
jgi:1,4-alpha-glucan branching enzyme